MYRLFDMDPLDVVTNGIAKNQTLAGAGDLTLDGDQIKDGVWNIHDLTGGSYSDGIGGVKIAIDSAGDISSVVFTVYGTDQDGQTRTEEITNVTTTAVQSTTYWKTITQIAADAAVGSNVFVGAVDEVVSETIPLNWRNNWPAAFVVASLSGTVQFDIQQSMSEFEAATDPSTLIWYDAQSNKTANIAGEFTRWQTAARLVWDSYSSGAELQFQVRQGDYNNL